MNTTELKNKLDAIVGIKQQHYNGKTYCIEKYKIVNGYSVVLFMPNPKNYTIAEVIEFLNYLSPVTIENKPIQEVIEKQPIQEVIENKPIEEKNLPEIIKAKVHPAVQYLPEENQSIKQTLLDTINKLKKDKEYLAQANGICSAVNAYIGLQKNEIVMMNLYNKTL